MYRYRVLMMLAGLLATATAVNAQTLPPLPPTPPERLPERLIDPPQESRFDSPGYPKQAYDKFVDSSANSAAWHLQAWQQTVDAWQRVRAICMTNQKNSTCCDAATKAVNCAAGVAASVKCCEVAQAPKSCACAKACACCEACKASKDGSARTQAQPMTAEMLRRLAGLHGYAPPPQPFPMAELPQCLPPVHGSGIVQIMPVPGVCVVQVVHLAKPVHFVTPDLDAHCERMHHRGDVVVLEGNVILLCKKHAQPIRIEAQRVAVNMRDGSFCVESCTQIMPTTTSFGVQRTSGVSGPVTYSTTAGSGIRVAVPMMGPAPCANDAPLAIPTRSAEPQRPGAINAEDLFRHLMQYYR